MDNSLGGAARQLGGASDHRRQRIHHALPLQHIERYRELVSQGEGAGAAQLSSKIPDELLDGNLELGVISYDPGDERLKSKVIYTDRWRSLSPRNTAWRNRKTVSITELGQETFIAHNVVSPYREVVLREFQRTKCRSTWTWRCRPSRPFASWCRTMKGVAFLPRMCVEQEIAQDLLVRGPGERNARRAQDPAGISDATGPQPCRKGVSGSGS